MQFSSARKKWIMVNTLIDSNVSYVLFFFISLAKPLVYLHRIFFLVSISIVFIIDVQTIRGTMHLHTMHANDFQLYLINNKYLQLKSCFVIWRLKLKWFLHIFLWVMNGMKTIRNDIHVKVLVSPIRILNSVTDSSKIYLIKRPLWHYSVA